MLWSGLTLIAFLAAAPHPLWTSGAASAFPPAGNPAVWSEYGLETAQQADFGDYKAVAYRFHDSTGAYAGWLWLKSRDRSAALDGNVAITCAGRCPEAKDLESRLDAGQILREAPSPLPSYLPHKGRVPGTERYVLGPASLAEFAAALPPADLAFPFSPEAAVATYRGPRGDLLLAIVSYPTPTMAREQAAEFRKLSGTVVKRSGPLVMVIPGAVDAATAQDLVSGISYQASVSWDEKPPDTRFFAKLTAMLLAIGELILFLLALCVTGGLAVGGARAFRERFGKPTADRDVIALHLSGK